MSSGHSGFRSRRVLQARYESRVIRVPFSVKERDSGSGSVYTYGTPPEKSHVASLGQFSLTSTNIAIPTILPQRLQGLYGHHMRHVRETMPGSGDSGTGAKPTPSHIHPYPTTNHAPHTQQAPRPRPPSDLPTFTKTHRGTYQPNEPNRPSHIHPTTNHTLHTQQAPRPRIRTTHALKTQTTSPKTPHIHSISPKWSALWAHTVQLEARRRRHNGCAYDLHHCGARTLHHRCK